MGHGLAAVLLAATFVPPSAGWIKSPLGEPDNYLETLPVIYNGVYQFTNNGSVAVQHNVGGQDSRSRTVSGSTLEGPPAESGPTWGAKFTPLSNSPFVTNWEVSWTVQPGYTWYVNMKYDHEIGTETWYRSGQGFKARNRSWHYFDEQTSTFSGPGGGTPGGGG